MKNTLLIISLALFPGISRAEETPNGLAPEITDLNAADISYAAEAKIPDLKKPFIDLSPTDLKDGISVGVLGEEQKKLVLAYAAEIAAGKHGAIDSLLLSHHGKLIFESYFRRGRINYPHYQLSLIHI